MNTVYVLIAGIYDCDDQNEQIIAIYKNKQQAEDLLTKLNNIIPPFAKRIAHCKYFESKEKIRTELDTEIGNITGIKHSFYDIPEIFIEEANYYD